MTTKSTYVSIGDCSEQFYVGSEESEGIQLQLRDKFASELNRRKPPGGIVGTGRAFNSAWVMRVGFQDKEEETDVYRAKIKEVFPDARVKNIAGGAEWILPYVRGIESGQSTCLTIIMFVFSGCLLFGIYQFFGL